MDLPPPGALVLHPIGLCVKILWLGAGGIWNWETCQNGMKGVEEDQKAGGSQGVFWVSNLAGISPRASIAAKGEESQGLSQISWICLSSLWSKLLFRLKTN